MADESMELQAAKRALKAAEEEAATARTRANIKPDDEEAQAYAKAAEAEEQRARERVNEVVNKENACLVPCLVVGLVPVLVLMVWVFWAIFFGDLSGGGPVAATQYCEHAVKQRLFSPSSADFQLGHSTKVISLGNDKYRLRSFVDSQNAFGAQVRTHFVCEVQGGDSLDDFRVVKLEILE